MAASEPDPRYAARFQRGWAGDAEVPADVDGSPHAEAEPTAAPVEGPRASAVAPALLAALVAALAIGALAWACLDPAFTTPPRPNPLAALRVVAAAAPGPLAVAVVAALAVAVHRTSRRVALLAAAALAAGFLVAAGAAAAGIARLTALTAPGPVSSGGIPLSDAAMAVYLQRVQALGALTEALPGLILASALALLLVVMVVVRPLVPRRPA